ncbi:MAG: hypothetical protein ACI4JT_10785 [Oscillospiraceae bacterium]
MICRNSAKITRKARFSAGFCDVFAQIFGGEIQPKSSDILGRMPKSAVSP